MTKIFFLIFAANFIFVQVAVGQLTDKQMTDNQVTDNQVTDNQVTDNQVTELSPLEISEIFVDQTGDSFAPKKIDKNRVKAIQSTDINRVLKEAPGVYVREEDGFGLRPNIGLRGTNPDRSKKVVLLEDEILIGPAPYAAPAAYYTPSLMTTESLEVYKGFSALIYGPNSVGGAIQYKTHQFTNENTGDLSLNSGLFNTQMLNLKLNHDFKNFKVFLNVGRINSDGFRKIDNGDKKGFAQNVALLKILKNVNFFDIDHILELRLGYSDEISQETYLGLSLDDFNNNSIRRYNSSDLDEIKWHHTKAQIELLSQITDNHVVKSSLYAHQFQRTWYRLDSFRDQRNLRDVLNNPGGTNKPFYDILTGAEDSTSVGSNGDLALLNNDRDYLSQGLQFISDLQFNLKPEINSKLKTKLLFHQDQIKRVHDTDYYSMLNSKLIRTNDARVAKDRNLESAKAYSLALQNENKYELWNLSLQCRYEHVDFKIDDDIKLLSQTRSDQVFLPGLSLAREFLNPLSETSDSIFQIKYAINQAATLAGLDSAGKEDREESLNQEISIQFDSKSRAEQFEILFFNNDYKNITGTCSGSTGCSQSQLDQQFNGGKAQIYGLEARLAKGFKFDSFWVPLQINYTQINAKFKSSFDSISGEWGQGLVQNGAKLPYVPQNQFTAIVGLERNTLKQSLIINHYGKMYDQAVEEGRLTIPSYGVIDYLAQYRYTKKINFRFKFDNILNKRYITSIRPFGYRSGKPQYFAIGMDYSF